MENFEFIYDIILFLTLFGFIAFVTVYRMLKGI